MESVKRWFREKIFWLRTGYALKEVNNGNPVEQVIVNVRGYYVEVLFDVETGEPVDFGWSRDALMFGIPVRDHYIAKRKGED